MKEYEIDYLGLLEQSLIGVYLVVGNKIVYVNQSGARMFGYQAQEIINHLSVLDLIHPDDRPLVQENIRKRLDGEINEIRYSFKGLRKDSSIIYCEVLGRRIDYHGQPAILGTLVDITEQYQLQEILRESNNLNETLLHTIPLPMDIVDEQNNILFMNQVLEKMVGKQAIGQKCYWTFRDNRIQCGNCPLREPFDLGETTSIETSGSFGGRTFEISHTGMIYQGKKAMLEVFHDITERKLLEKTLKQSQELLEKRVEERTTELSKSNLLLKKLSRRLVKIQEEERQHIARELHDEIGQSLTSLKLLLEISPRLPAKKRKESADLTLSQVNELLKLVHNMSLNLRPSMLDDLGLLPTLEWHFKRFTSQTQVQVDFKQNEIDRRFSIEVETAVYRIIQEALTNVARHAGVKEVSVALVKELDKLHLEISDRGKGFDLNTELSTVHSSGLTGMQDRVMLLGGKLSIESVPGTGTTVKAELPLEKSIKKP